MNYSTAVFLINPKTRAVACTYEDNRTQQVIFKTFDATIKKDDLVVVPTNTRHKFTVVKVEAVDVPVDYDSPCQMDWIVAKIDLDNHERVLGQEQDAIEMIRSAEERRKRDELAKSLLANAGDGIRTLAIAGIAADPAI